MFIHHQCAVHGADHVVTYERWLQCVLEGSTRPKPPNWWLRQQEAEGRDARLASIIWNRNYKSDRKYVIWSQAPMADFVAAGYTT